MEVKIPYVTLLTQSQVEQVHETSLKILEEVGISTDSHAISKLCEEAGVQVGGNSRRIKIPRKVVENALKTAPREVTLFGRDPKHDMLLEEGKVYFGFGGTGVPYMRDLETGTIRVPTKKDVADGSRLGDALSGISYMMVLSGAYDFPSEVQYLHELEAKFNNTTKPIVHPAPGARYAQRVLEMATVVAGGQEEFKKRPMIALYSNPPSPLFFPEITEDIIEFAKAMAPTVLCPCPILGATGPGTVIGSFASGIAELLFGVVLSQLANPGAPVILGNHLGIIDMRTTRSCYAAIEWAMGRAMTAQIARFYDLPSHGQGGCSDAKIPDAQAGAEAAITALISAQSGLNMIQNVGTMAGGSLGSFELAVINDEVIGMVERFLQGVNVSPETLAFDVVNEIGPEGEFLTHDHTLTYFRKELYFPKLFDRQSEQSWLNKGGKTIFETAKERAKDLIRTHQVPPLSMVQQLALSNIIREAEKEFTNR